VIYCLYSAAWYQGFLETPGISRSF